MAKNASKPAAKNASKTKNKKPNFLRRIGAKIKETFSELKRVTWPKFGTVLKTTGLVLVIVLAFLLILTFADFGLTQLLSLLVSGKFNLPTGV